MKIAIIGAGFTGLAAAYDLAKARHEITIFESNSAPGGLASGFYDDNWQWPLDHHYHHVFANDRAVKRLLGEIELSDHSTLKEQLFYKKTQTYSLLKDEPLRLQPLDSVASLLAYPDLSCFSKLRTGAVLAGLKLLPNGTALEKYTAQQFLQTLMGQASWQQLWQPLFEGKFAQHASEINAAWFWARVWARSQQLGYFHKGFLGLSQELVKVLTKMDVEFNFNSTVTNIKQAKAVQQTKASSKVANSNSFSKPLNPQSLIITLNKTQQQFEHVIFTGNSQQLLQLAKDDLPSNYVHQLQKLESLSAMSLILVLDKPFFQQDIYWLNINRTQWPFLAVVEHTNFIDKAHYANQHLVYVGKYLSAHDKSYQFSAQQLLAIYQPYLEQLSPGFSKNLIKTHLFKHDFAQPLVKKNHSLVVPSIFTPLANLSWAGMQHVYPYDRGINYAIQLGRDAAQKILQ